MKGVSMTKAWQVITALIAAIIFAALGAYVLYAWPKTGTSLAVGAGFILLAVAIALPIPLHKGVENGKEVIAVVPIIVGAIRGGRRVTDPPTPATAAPAEPATPPASADDPESHGGGA